jgi:2-methylcitrate dehydratase PrpD
MNHDPDHTRRWLINAGGAGLVSVAMPLTASVAQAAAAAIPVAADTTAAQTEDGAAVSRIAAALADYVAKTLDRELPPVVVARTKLHVLDTLAAMVSGSRLKPGQVAARYVDSLGGKPQASVIGTRIVTSAVNAAFANGMAAHADETDDSNPTGPFHPGCGSVSAALATAELTRRTGNDVLRAVAVGYDVGTRVIRSFGGVRRHSPSPVTTTFAATAAAAAMLRLDPQQVRYAFAYAGQQASGIGYWDRDLEHVEKSFDFGGMGSRNGVMAATMVAMGFTAVEDPFSGSQNVFTALADKPSPEALTAGLGTTFEVFSTTIKKWSVGVPLQSVLDSMTLLLEDPAVRAGSIRRIVVEVNPDDLHIIDNNPSPSLCLQHVVALMIADGGTTFAKLHDEARMRDPRVLAIRKLVEALPNDELRTALPARQTIVRIETADGRTLSRRTSATLVRGTAGNPMDAKEVEAKALDLMAPVLGAARANELIAVVGSLDGLGPVSGLRRLLQA